MAMAGMTPNLFKWNRQTSSKPQNYSKGDVQDWIKRVERASTEAAREVFGRNYQSVLEQVHVDDDALAEAQDLLESWMHEKTLDDFNLEVKFKGEKWAQVSSPFKRSASAKDLFLDDSFDDSFDDIVNLSGGQSLQTQTGTGNNFQSNLSPNIMGAEYDDELNDEISVREILQEMLHKKVVKKDILNDLGFDKRKHREDPRRMMELRHQQVKAQSKARQKELEKRRREKAACKQAEAEAHKQLLREEKEREAQIKREEEAIQKEMTKIRQAMEQEKKAAKEKVERDLHKDQMAEILARQYLEQEQRLKKEQEINDIEEKEKICNVLEQMEEKAVEKTRKNLRALQKYFSMWYSVVAVQRIKLGKAQALCDWRCKLHAWNAWRVYVNHIKSDKEAQAVANEMKEKHRKEQLSLKFNRHHQLLRCLRAWQLWVRRELEQRQLQEEHNSKTKKMAALLEAAATGRLWSKQVGDTLSLELEDIEDNTELGSRTSTSRKVDEIFAQPVRTIPSRRPLVSETNLAGDSSTKMANGNRPATYKQAWIAGKEQSISTEWPEKVEKVARSERAIKVKSQRQHSYSEVDQVECLYPNSTNDKMKRRKDTSTSAKSHNRLQLQGIVVKEEKETLVLSERSMSPGAMDNQMAATPTKVNSRESVIKPKKPITKPLHLAMEERAKERKNRKAALEKKKRKAEEQKLAFLKMEQERKETELLAEKQEALRKRKEEKRLAKERELEKQRQLEHSRQQTTLAEQHYATALLKKYGMLPWRYLVLMTREKMSCAVLNSNLVTLRSCFYPWLKLTRQVREKRDKAADMLYSGILLRRTWRQWKKYGQHALRLQMVADDFWSSYLLGKYFKYWQDYVTVEQIMLWQKEKRADEHNEWRLMKLAVIQWKKYIPLTRSEREKQARREELRRRVHSWLPDFQAGGKSSP